MLPGASHGLRLQDDRILFDTGFVVSFVRTSRVPENGGEYPLTAHHGEFRVRAARAYLDAVPTEWAERGVLFAPAYEGEAFWISFEGRRPHAVQVEANGDNALSGEGEGAPLRDAPQNYIVCPPQRWLDAFYRGRRMNQFVAGRRGSSLDRGGVTVRVFPRRAEQPSPGSPQREPFHSTLDTLDIAHGGTLAAGILPDPLGLEYWDRSHPIAVPLQFVDVAWYVAVTGEDPPDAPASPPHYQHPPK